MEMLNAEDLLKNYSIILIRIAKLVGEGVIGIKILEQWYKLKIHEMSLIYYFRKKK